MNTTSQPDSSHFGDPTASEGVWSSWHSESTPIRLGVSSCLLGEMVRFDGGHSRDRFVADTLGAWVDWTPVCPEMESGLTAPRPTMRLVQEGDRVTLEVPSTGEDLTESMESFAKERTGQLEGLDGFVFKRNSPTCGLERVKVYRENGHVNHKEGVGLFAKQLQETWPGLPVEEDGRLNDPELRENFIERVFCRNRWRTLVKQGVTRERLVAFHTAHKLLLRSHHEGGYRAMGRVVGSFGTKPDEEVFAEYECWFTETLSHLVTTKKHTNVIEHALGYLKTELDPKEKRQIHATLEDYRLGLTPLLVPLTLLRFSIVKYEVEYLLGQLYFDPHPKELMLRNHA